MGRHQKDFGSKVCDYCKATFIRKRAPDGKVLEEGNVFKRRRFCSMKCSGLAHRKPDAKRSALLKRVVPLRKKSCEKCGATKKLGTHHKDRNWRNNEPDNLETLCSSCHSTHHHERGEIMPKRQPLPCRICGKPSERRDLCGKHRQRIRVHGDPTAVIAWVNGVWMRTTRA